MSSTIEVLTVFLNYFSLTILFWGLIGNILVYKIYSSDAFKKFTLSIYFRSIAIIDSLNLLNLILIFLNQQFQIDLSQSIGLFCLLQTYMTYTLGAISAWLMVIVSFDRFFKIGYPKRFSLFFNKKIQLTLIIVANVFNFAYYSFITWNSFLLAPVNDTNQTTTSCSQNYDVSMLGWMDFFNSTVLPFVLMISLSSGMIFFVIRSRLRVRLKDESQRPRMSTRDRKFAIGLITLDFLFLTLNLPVVVFYFYYYNVQQNPTDDLINYFLNQLYYFNSAIGFYVQLVINSIFRAQFLAFLGLNPRNGSILNADTLTQLD